MTNSYHIFKPTPEKAAITRSQVEAFILEVQICFALNFPKCNDDKTVFVVFGSGFKASPSLYNITIEDGDVEKVCNTL